MRWEELLSTERIGPTTATATASRSAFDGDYDRAVFSTPLRRLQDKAQVFPLERNDAVRTRLTHSLEVSTVARSLARQAVAAVQGDDRIPKDEKPTDDQARFIETIAATCGLIHDLGNPPFGHAGERAIADWFQRHSNDPENDPLKPLGVSQHKCDFLRFEGNAQTIRLVSRLQVLADDNGLNLTLGTLSAALKYTAASHAIGDPPDWKERRKPGFFASEQELIDKVRARTGTGEARNPIAFLVEAADDIVYSACDLEDAVKKGVLQGDDLESRLLDSAREMGGIAETTIKDVMSAAQQSLDRQRERSTTQLSVQRDSLATAFRIKAQATAIASVIDTFREHYVGIMRGQYHQDLAEQGPAGGIVLPCKSVAANYVYSAGPTPKLEVLGRNVLQDLMDLVWSSVESLTRKTAPGSFEGKIASLMSSNYRDVAFAALDRKQLPERYVRLQLVTDFVCGMTDSFARDLHREVFNG